MPIFRKINKNFFKEWNKEMAYVLGFIYADGNIVHSKRGTWFWSVQVTDRYIVEQIKKVCGSEHTINIKKAHKNMKTTYRIQIGSKEMCRDLFGLGVVERKSKILNFPRVPDKFFPSFLRGYFDGDGGVWVGLKNKKSANKKYVISTYFTSGSKKFLQEMQIKLKELGIVGGSLVKKERGFDLKYSVRNSSNLYKIMYNDVVSGLFLARKRNKFEKYMKMRS